MKSLANTIIEDERNIEIAACWTAPNERNTPFEDANEISFLRIMQARREYAKKYFKIRDYKTIRQILGV